MNTTKRFVLKPELREITGLSDSTRHRQELKGEFPLRRQISPNRVGWVYAEVIEWLENREVVSIAANDGNVDYNSRRLT